MITVNNLSKTYGKGENLFEALKSVSLNIPDKSTVAIVGKSGSGKSTLMHLMSGLDHPTNGTIEIDGVDIYKLKANELDNFRASKMSFIFQSFFIESNQTCYENVMLPLEINKVATKNRRQLVMKALTSVELESKANKLAGTLSGGQKQRLAIARAIVNDPKILFADEPTGNLDTVTGDRITKLLFDLNKRLGCTLIIVTHDHDLAKKCQMRINIKDGMIESNVKSNKAKKAK